MNDELLDEQEQQDDQHEDSFPDMEVHVDETNLQSAGNDTVFRALLALDIDKACAVIAEKPKRRGTFEKSPEIMVTLTDTGLLELAINTSAGVWVNVHMDPTKLDRTKPKHEDLLQRCAAIVQAMQEATVAGKDVVDEEEQEGENPRLYPFEFWLPTDDEDVAKWANLAEVWTAASK